MKIFFLTLIAFGFLNAEAVVKKVIFDLTTKEIATFETKLLSGVAHQKAYYEGQLEELEVSVMIHGGAYKFFVKDLASSPFKEEKELAKVQAEFAKRIASLSEIYEVEFLLCEAGMKGLKMEKKQFYDVVKLVPNAGVGLIDRQNEGFAYIPIH